MTADPRPEAERPAPANWLSEGERERIVATCHERVLAIPPSSQIVPRLADRGYYIASESSFHRVMRERAQTSAATSDSNQKGGDAQNSEHVTSHHLP